MERNWDLIREILRILAEKDNYDKEFALTHFTNNLPKELSNEGLVRYHLDMMIEAGFIHGTKRADGCNTYYSISGMTWQGQDLWSSIKEISVWNKIKKYAKDKQVDLCFDAIKIIAPIVLQQILS